MYGRYGVDQFSLFLMGLYLVLYLAANISRLGVLGWLAMLPAIFAIFRMFSRNLAKRRAENAKFMELAGPLIRWVRMRRTIHRDKDHCYFKCPTADSTCGCPRGRGKLPSPAATAA